MTEATAPTMDARRSTFLLIEPDSLMRRTVAGVARDLNLARVREASTYDAASKMLKADHFDGVIVAVAQNGEGLSLIEMLRTGATKCPPDCPVAVLAAVCDMNRAKALQGLKVRRVILTPFKVKTVLETVADMAETSSEAPQKSPLPFESGPPSP